MILLSGFLLGIAGSVHCIGMCGPIAAYIPRSGFGGKTGPLLDRLLYHVGRMATYTLLGFVIGTGTEYMHWGAVGTAITIVAGLGMIVSALMQLVYHRSVVPAMAGRVLSRFASNHIRALATRGTLLRITAMGMLNGIVPCGLVVSALAGAAAMPDRFAGGMFMAAFGAGTAVCLIGVSLGLFAIVPARWRSSKSWAPALAMVAGIVVVVRGVMFGMPMTSTAFEPGQNDHCYCSHK